MKTKEEIEKVIDELESDSHLLKIEKENSTDVTERIINTMALNAAIKQIEILKWVLDAKQHIL